MVLEFCPICKNYHEVGGCPELLDILLNVHLEREGDFSMHAELEEMKKFSREEKLDKSDKSV